MELCLKLWTMASWKVLVVLSLVIADAWGDYSVNQCEWLGSGLHTDPSDRIIQQVYLKCIRGQVEWQFPNSAIRVTFQFLDTKEDFRLCIRPSAHSAGANIYRHVPYGDLVLLIEDDRPDLKKLDIVPEEQLKKIVAKELHRTHPREIHCFESQGGKASLFLEAMRNPLSLPLITHFEYVLEPLKENPMDLYHRYDDCRKCNVTELVRAFCSSDFVIKARMLDITNDAILSQSFIDVSISHIYKQRDAIFTPALKSRYHGTILRRTECGTVRESAHYLMTGGIVLGQAKLGCWMRFQEARRLFLQMTNSHLNECDLHDVINFPTNHKLSNAVLEDHEGHRKNAPGR